MNDGLHGCIEVTARPTVDAAFEGVPTRLANVAQGRLPVHASDVGGSIETL